MRYIGSQIASLIAIVAPRRAPKIANRRTADTVRLPIWMAHRGERSQGIGWSEASDDVWTVVRKNAGSRETRDARDNRSGDS
jgi:hypothetical protein